MNLDPLLTDVERLLRESAHKFAERHGGAQRLRRLRETPRGYDAEALSAAAAAGWIGLLVPESAGGAGLGPGSLAHVCEALGREFCALPLGCAAAAASALAACAVPPRSAIEALLKGEALALCALAPAPGPRGAAPISLEPDGAGGYRVCGRWEGLPALAAEHFVVEASAAAEHVVFHLAAGAQGLSLVPGRAIEGSALAALVLEGARVPAAAVIASGEAAKRLSARLYAAVQLALSAEMLGLADGSAARTLEYLATRVQFGQPIGKFQALRHQAVDNYVHKELARALVFEAARAADAGHEDAARLCCAARVFAGEASLAVAKSSIQMHGAIGFTDEHDIGLYLKRAMALSGLAGPTGAERRRYRRSTRTGGGAWADLPRIGVESEADARFRAEVREWLEANLPHRLRDIATRAPHHEGIAWHRQLYERGWIAPGWPKEHGGMGATLVQQVILADELARIGAPEISAQAINHIGPILIRFGTEAQKKRHLSKMLSGEAVWCQGYSEPNSGSDLASLRTRALIDGDDFVVSGQKIWTTWAHHAHWMFALVRTDPQAPKKHDGISFILIDMKSPGITARGIRTIAGEDELAQVFLDEVRVPRENLVGELHGGWKVANALLVNERIGSASTQRDLATLRYAWRFAVASGIADDEAFADRLAGAEVDLLALSAAHAQAVALLSRAQVGAESSFMKIAGTALLQRLSDLAFEAAHCAGGAHGPVSAGGIAFDAARSLLQNRRATIYGGTQEIQKDIVAKRVLGMP
ncbi:MAG: acyl-CoA dehydrogenase family protein [Burkholderiales bacterium]|nr:acyl-CoA dehydrogenase family protein [Burkholderiales bacterium]